MMIYNNILIDVPLERELNVDMLPLVSSKNIPLYSIINNLQRIWAKESIDEFLIVLSDKGGESTPTPSIMKTTNINPSISLNIVLFT